MIWDGYAIVSAKKQQDTRYYIPTPNNNAAGATISCGPSNWRTACRTSSSMRCLGSGSSFARVFSNGGPHQVVSVSKEGNWKVSGIACRRGHILHGDHLVRNRSSRLSPPRLFIIPYRMRTKLLQSCSLEKQEPHAFKGDLPEELLSIQTSSVLYLSRKCTSKET